MWRWSHPLYEDVNWNVVKEVLGMAEKVILYMRMWIEMPMAIRLMDLFKVILYMRMWIEIVGVPIIIVVLFVILYMRMWIEIFPQYDLPQSQSCHPLYEDVNWNISVYLFIRLSPCHPLYEDVNWNTPSRRDNISARVSSSIWGCELKYHVIGI